MSERKHTPGPWYEADDRIRDAASDAIVATIEDGGHVELELFTSADRKKHARIIAAAPDMLDALKAILVEAQHNFSGCAPGPWKRMPPNLRAAIDRSRDAIAKAEGRS